MALENAGFQLPQRKQVPPNRLFNNSTLPIDLPGVNIPHHPEQYLGSRKSKSVWLSSSGPSSLLTIGSTHSIHTSIFKVAMIPQHGFGCIKPSPPMEYIYQLIVSSFSECTCPAFKETMSKFGKRGCSFKHYKHMYYIFVKVCGLDPKFDLFIHASTFSFNEVKLLLESGILTHSIT